MEGTTSPLKELREKRGMTQEGLAYISKVDQATISRIERGDFNGRPETIVALARALGTRPQKLYPRDKLKG